MRPQRGEQVLTFELAARLLQGDPLLHQLAHETTEVTVEGGFVHSEAADGSGESSMGVQPQREANFTMLPGITRWNKCSRARARGLSRDRA